MRKQTTATNDTVTIDRPEELDIPDEALTGSGQIAPEKPVYRWSIPSDALSDYVKTIDITDAESVEEARKTALLIRFGVKEAFGEKPADPGRGLTTMERAYVLATEPVIVKDTETITLTHAMAVYLNEQLINENEGYRRIKEVLTDYEIDPENPHEWIEEQEWATQQIRDGIHKTYGSAVCELASGLESAIMTLKKLADKTGFATPAPVVAPEPDYSKLTIFTQDVEAAAKEYPRLAGATIIEYVPGEDLSESEKRGREMLCKDDGFIERAYRGFHNPTDEKALRDIQARLLAEWK